MSIFLIFIRIWVGYHVIFWLISESLHPELHNITEIEFYLVIMVFDTWAAKSQDNIDIKVIKNEEN